MSGVSTQEICAGLSVRLDTQQLRNLGGCRTNASAGPPDRAVQGPHQFLILEIDAARNECLAVPLFTNQAPGNRLLDKLRMTGTLPAWLNGTYHYSIYQHWWIPLAHIPGTSGTEITAAGSRSYYARTDAAELASIAGTIAMNKFGFRAI